ncbi:MAG: hypothetical protein KME49_28825 [Brasilonema octagenarum HA4186-MV1]|nr:hypothetical protein [Brasilonema octagenarum HA4186-MV1]
MGINSWGLIGGGVFGVGDFRKRAITNPPTTISTPPLSLAQLKTISLWIAGRCDSSARPTEINAVLVADVTSATPPMLTANIPRV